MQQEITQYYSDIADEYDNSRFSHAYGQYIHAQELRVFNRQKLPLPCLSLGCGTGRMMEFASMGADISEAMLNVAKQKHPQKEFVCCDAVQTSFLPASFQSVFCLHLFMHLEVNKGIDIIKETHRILPKGGLFLFDFPSSYRRNFFKQKQKNWHAATHYSLEFLQEKLSSEWQIISYTGVLFFPVHRLPAWLSRAVLPIDNWLCRSFLRKYASYLMVVLEKK